MLNQSIVCIRVLCCGAASAARCRAAQLRCIANRFRQLAAVPLQAAQLPGLRSGRRRRSTVWRRRCCRWCCCVAGGTRVSGSGCSRLRRKRQRALQQGARAAARVLRQQLPGLHGTQL